METKIPPFSSNEPINSRKFKEDEQRHETEFLTENVSYLSKDIQYKSQRVRVRREEEELRKTMRTSNRGSFLYRTLCADFKVKKW